MSNYLLIQPLGKDKSAIYRSLDIIQNKYKDFDIIVLYTQETGLINLTNSILNVKIDPDNFFEIISNLEKYVNLDNYDKILVNITPGTKLMSAALSIYAYKIKHFKEVHLLYVSGKRDKTGKVITGSEILIDLNLSNLEGEELNEFGEIVGNEVL